jgi:hypothetical protein
MSSHRPHRNGPAKIWEAKISTGRYKVEALKCGADSQIDTAFRHGMVRGGAGDNFGHAKKNKFYKAFYNVLFDPFLDLAILTKKREKKGAKVTICRRTVS